MFLQNSIHQPKPFIIPCQIFIPLVVRSTIVQPAYCSCLLLTKHDKWIAFRSRFIFDKPRPIVAFLLVLLIMMLLAGLVLWQ
jgi:hypothetical protein